MQAIVVTLTIRDNLLATGLKHIFKNLFDIDARIFNTTQELKQTDINPDLTITDHSNFVADYGFFIQKETDSLLFPTTSKLIIIISLF